MMTQRQIMTYLAEVLPKWKVDGFEYEYWEHENIIHIECNERGVNLLAEYNYKTNYGEISWNGNYWEAPINTEYASRLSGEMWLTFLVNIYFQIYFNGIA